MTVILDRSVDTLQHHGVKGMKWGVRKKEDTTPRVSSAAPNLREGTAAAVASSEKMDASGAGGKRLSPEQRKKLIYGAAGSVAVLGLLGGAYYLHSTYGTSLPKPGEALDVNHFKDLVSTSRVSVERGGLHPSSYKRPEFTVKAGTVFHRISSAQETGFGPHTYSSSNLADFNRYASHLKVTNPGGVSGLQHVTFKATSDIRVPSLSTNLKVLQGVMGEGGKAASPEQALTQYKSFMGTAFVEDRGLSSRFFEALSKQGYSAIVDEADAGVIAHRPLILFNHAALSAKTSETLSDQLINRAATGLTELQDRKL